MKIGFIIGGIVNLLAGLVLGFLAVLPFIQHESPSMGRLIPLSVVGFCCIIVGIVLLAVSAKMGSFLGVDKKLLANGRPATALIKSVKDTGISMRKGMYLVLEFQLEVTPEMGSPYPVACRSMVSRVAMGMITPGKPLRVMVDPNNPNHVAIDWSTAQG